MEKFIALLGGLLICASTALSATPTLDPIVVTATRTATPLSQIGSSVTVITAEEIEEKQQQTVVDVLRSVPGVTVNQSGPIGGQASIFLRGTDNKHTLVLIDGIEYRDASAIGGDINLANLSTSNIEQIEIVRGAQSVLYGSDAIAGVINIITKKDVQGMTGEASAEMGSFNTNHIKAGLGYGNEIVTSSFRVAQTNSDGFSAANEDDGNSEKDGYENTSFLFNFGLKPIDVFELNFNVQRIDAENDFDNFFAGIASDADNKDQTLDTIGQLSGTLHLLDNLWNMTFAIAVSDLERDTALGTYHYGYDGRITKSSLLNEIHVGRAHTLVIGLETEKEEYDGYADFEQPTHEEARTDAFFIQDQFRLNNFSMNLGLRSDDHEQFGEETTWRLATSYALSSTGTIFKGSVGTGFKAPSLYQLYHPYFGNTALEAETSLGYDIGIEQSWLQNSVITSLTWFHNSIKDYIEFDDIGYTGYYQGGDIQTQGVEATVSYSPCPFFSTQLGYTYTDSKDENGERRARRPLHKGTLDLNLYPIDGLQINLNTIYNSERDDNAANETLPSYTLVNLATSYQINDNLKIFGRIDNLFDKDYEEVSGYGTAGLSAYAGIKLSF
ncbi:MAG: TonB-dependent receptor [Desulfuromonadales bacterium]|nr:TonB-dependent receptor [Desulfuromonadales bacterium]MBN2792818.1 TonB-dependent receptor [Desulfuromonadales bacterium]